MNIDFWKGKKVFLTGHTGFKGSWMSLWLYRLGASVYGFSQEPPTSPSLFAVANIKDILSGHTIGDVRDFAGLSNALEQCQPDIVIHMAAQPLVRLSYDDPVLTYETNVMGTVNLLQAIRNLASVKAVVNVTSDKCYENKEWHWGYRENEPMGGYDPYSNSKGCSELVTDSFRKSFFPPDQYDHHGVALASGRAGNVIGGGDWADDRLIPDILRAFEKKQPVVIRNPASIRPWQHVLEPLSGYLLLAEYLYVEGGTVAEGWNFGPKDQDTQPVRIILDEMVQVWGEGAQWQLDENPQPHEAKYLKLDCSKAISRLKWQPRWDLMTALSKIVKWHQAWLAKENMQAITFAEIESYMQTPAQQ